MRAAGRWIVTAALCGAAIWAGWTLGRQPGMGQAVSIVQMAATLSGPVTVDSLHGKSTPFRQAAARCDTSALWLWIQGHLRGNSEAFQAAAQELLDREGAAAIRHACDLEDPEQRRTISDALLAAYSSKDVWAAYEIYQELCGRFDAEWGDRAVRETFRAACGISADRLIACMIECPGKGRPEQLGFHETAAAFAPRFDFPKLAAYLDSLNEPPRFILDDLLGFWMKQSPVDAVSWYLAKGSRSSYVRGRDGTGLVSQHSGSDFPQTMYFSNDFMESVIESEGSREERIAALRLIPEDSRDELWAALLSGRWAVGERGVLDPKFLDVAEVVTGREDFLARKLLETRGLGELDPSWSVVPAGERGAVIQECLRRWEKAEPTGVGGRAREQWQAWLRREWH